MCSKELSEWSPYVKTYDPLKAGSIDGTDTIPHDNAVVRAMCAEHVPPDERVTTSNPSHTLFVGRLNLRTSERQLEKEFAYYGDIKSCRIVRDIITGTSRGYGFVEFKKKEDAERAWKHAHGIVYHDRQIIVEWEFGRTMPGWIPRRLGGGLGGKKESGQLRFGGRDRPFRKPFILPSNVSDDTSRAVSEEYDSDKPRDVNTRGSVKNYGADSSTKKQFYRDFATSSHLKHHHDQLSETVNRRTPDVSRVKEVPQRNWGDFGSSSSKSNQSNKKYEKHNSWYSEDSHYEERRHSRSYSYQSSSSYHGKAKQDEDGYKYFEEHDYRPDTYRNAGDERRKGKYFEVSSRSSNSSKKSKQDNHKSRDEYSYKSEHYEDSYKKSKQEDYKSRDEYSYKSEHYEDSYKKSKQDDFKSRDEYSYKSEHYGGFRKGRKIDGEMDGARNLDKDSTASCQDYKKGESKRRGRESSNSESGNDSDSSNDSRRARKHKKRKKEKKKKKRKKHSRNQSDSN